MGAQPSVPVEADVQDFLSRDVALVENGMGRSNRKNN
jgi:hypothetical protein